MSVNWIKRFMLFHGKRHPRDMGAGEIGASLTHLPVARQVSANTQNHALNAIVSLYKHVFKMDIGQIEPLDRAKRPRRV